MRIGLLVLTWVVTNIIMFNTHGSCTRLFVRLYVCLSVCLH